MTQITIWAIGEAYMSQMQFSVIEDDMRYGVIWRQFITREGGLIGQGSLSTQKFSGRRRGYCALMRARIFKMRENYKKRVTTLTNVDNIPKPGAFD